MTLETKRIIIASLGGLFLLSLVFVQWMETARKAEEAGLREPHIAVPAADALQEHDAQGYPGRGQKATPFHHPAQLSCARDQ